MVTIFSRPAGVLAAILVFYVLNVMFPMAVLTRDHLERHLKYMRERFFKTSLWSVGNFYFCKYFMRDLQRVNSECHDEQKLLSTHWHYVSILTGAVCTLKDNNIELGTTVSCKIKRLMNIKLFTVMLFDFAPFEMWQGLNRKHAACIRIA